MRQTRIHPWLVVTILGLLVVGVVIIQGGPLALVTLGTRFSEGDPNGSEGYDGQFVYYIASDPATAAAKIDVPAYRFQRILLPAAGRALAFGQPPLVPWTLLAVNLASLALGTWLMERLLVRQRASRWYALAYGLALGTLGAVRLSLPEPLAYALALGGTLLALRERWLLAALLFALAALARETTLLFPFGFGLYLLSRRQFSTALGFGLAAVLPFAAWQVVLFTQFGQLGIGSGGAMATGFELLPFAGVARIFTETPAEAHGRLLLIFMPILVPFVLAPTFWALWRCWRDRGHWSAVTFLLFANAAVMPFVPFSTYREPVAILRFIVGLQIAVILYAAAHRHPRALRFSTLWIVTLLFLFTLLPEG